MNWAEETKQTKPSMSSEVSVIMDDQIQLLFSEKTVLEHSLSGMEDAGIQTAHKKSQETKREGVFSLFQPQQLKKTLWRSEGGKEMGQVLFRT